jgi:hypothetical protein
LKQSANQEQPEGEGKDFQDHQAPGIDFLLYIPHLFISDY